MLGGASSPGDVRAICTAYPGRRPSSIILGTAPTTAMSPGEPRFFLLKNPAGLRLIREEYRAEELVPSCSQARFRGDKSNTKLLRCSDGEWYIKNGSRVTRLKSVGTREMTVAVAREGGGDFVGNVSRKWFLEKGR